MACRRSQSSSSSFNTIGSMYCDSWSCPLPLHCNAERGSSPSSCHGRDPLIVAIREATLKVDLELRGSAIDVPRTIGGLRRQQELHTSSEHFLVGLKDSRIDQRP